MEESHRCFRIKFVSEDHKHDLGLVVFSPNSETAEFTGIDSYERIYSGSLIGVFQKAHKSDRTEMLIDIGSRLYMITLNTEEVRG